MTKIKTLRATDGRVDGRTNGITLRGPRGPKNMGERRPGMIILVIL